MFDSFYKIIVFLIGIIGSLITIISWFPQAIKTFKTKDTSGISIKFFILIYLSTIFWIIYSLLILINPYEHQLSIKLIAGLPVLITNLCAIVLHSIIIFIKSKNLLNAKKVNMSEYEYINKVLNNKK